MTSFGQSEMPFLTEQNSRTEPNKPNKANRCESERPNKKMPPPLGGAFCSVRTGPNIRDFEHAAMFAPAIAEQPHHDPADNYPTRASRAAAFNQWDRDHAAWIASGMVGEYPHPPAGLTSAIADRLMPRRTPHHGKRWR